MGIKTTQYYRHEARNRIGKAGYLISALLMDSSGDEIELDLARVHLTDALVALQGRPGLSLEARLELLAATGKSLTTAGHAVLHLVTLYESSSSPAEVDTASVLTLAGGAIKDALAAVDSAKTLSQKS